MVTFDKGTALQISKRLVFRSSNSISFNVFILLNDWICLHGVSD